MGSRPWDQAEGLPGVKTGIFAKLRENAFQTIWDKGRARSRLRQDTSLTDAGVSLLYMHLA